MGNADSLRTGETIERYRLMRRADIDLRELPRLWVGRYWAVVENQFPYDKISASHHLLVPLRVFKEESEMSIDELGELHRLKRDWGESRMYDSVMVNLPHNRTVPHLFHYHLLKFKSLAKF